MTTSLKSPGGRSIKKRLASRNSQGALIYSVLIGLPNILIMQWVVPNRFRYDFKVTTEQICRSVGQTSLEAEVVLRVRLHLTTINDQTERPVTITQWIIVRTRIDILAIILRSLHIHVVTHLLVILYTQTRVIGKRYIKHGTDTAVCT